jgi:hypothetical protein
MLVGNRGEKVYDVTQNNFGNIFTAYRGVHAGWSERSLF